MIHEIAIVGAASLLGKELKEALTESPMASAHFRLLDEPDAQGQLDQIGDEMTVIQVVEADSFNGADFTFFCGSRLLTRRFWKQAIASGSTVLDLSGELDSEPGVMIRSPWIHGGETLPDLLTQAVVPACAASLALVLIISRLAEVASPRFLAATVLQPASELGKEGLDELHQQTVSLLSFQSIPQTIFDTQTAFNTLANYGENSAQKLSDAENRLRLHYSALVGDTLPRPRLQLLQASVFHGHAFSICVELEQPVPLALLEDAFGGEHLDLVMEATDSPSNLSAVGQNDVLVWIKTEPPVTRGSGETSRFWLWAASDNLRLAAQNAVDCALDLRRLRPQGQVQ